MKCFWKFHTAREVLRKKSVDLSGDLVRSVARLTSYDALPCTEYRDEVEAQHRLMARINYVQRCRAALEDCIDGRNVRVRSASGWTGFYRTDDGGVKITGLDI